MDNPEPPICPKCGGELPKIAVEVVVKNPDTAENMTATRHDRAPYRYYHNCGEDVTHLAEGMYRTDQNPIYIVVVQYDSNA